MRLRIRQSRTSTIKKTARRPRKEGSNCPKKIVRNHYATRLKNSEKRLPHSPTEPREPPDSQKSWRAESNEGH
jgi:hypothetical protein